MKAVKCTIIILLTFALANFAYAQSIISAKIIPLKYQLQTDTLRLPVVSGKYPALKRALSYTTISDGDTLANVIANYDTCGCGTTGLDYGVTFENKTIISIRFTFQTMGAYPDSYSKWFTLNVYTGKPYFIDDEINPQGLQMIYKMYKDTLKKRILADKQANTDEDTSTYNELNTAIDSLQLYDVVGKYVFTKQGIVVSIDRILPHVVQSFEPDDDLFIPYDELRKYKKSRAIVIP
jgi:hypothetical protein